MSTQPLQIAIDGPVASGKGEVAKLLAKKLNLLYLYTGAMYRALAVACIENGIDCKDAANVLKLLTRTSIDLIADTGTQQSYKILLNGRDVTEKIFSSDAAQGSSDVGTIAEVRAWMAKRQSELAADKPVVAEGRDIGIRVLPQAQMKIYLTASVQERAKRRQKQFSDLGKQMTFEEVLEDTKRRDLQDTTRTVDPLQKLPEAWEFDTTGLTLQETVDRIIKEIKTKGLI